LGGAADETFALTRNPSVAALAIDGGGGVNTLDYLSVWSREVTAAEDGAIVNLAEGAATGARGGVARIHNVIGSPGNDLIVGNGGNILDGRGGRDVLIAGGAASVLLGGEGEDLLIAGTTAYDSHAASLAAIQAEWNRTDLSYDVRVANLTSDNGALVPKLIPGTTVFDNGGGNQLSGGADALDLYFASLDLDVTDLLDEEEALLPL
jgi:Ca2+-binding RTX toxin-like protein